MGVSGLHAVFTNPFYCGQVRWNGELIDGGHEPLVSKEMFRAAQQTLKSN
jgi:site-specific DNA recombinase